MAITKSLTITTTPANITVQTVCSTVTIKEDESVSNWPTSALLINKSGDNDTLTSGKSYQFQCTPGKLFTPGQILGTLSVPTGSTTGIQDES